MNYFVFVGVTVALIAVYQIPCHGVPINDRAVPHFCINGTECTDNECCLMYETELIVVGRSIVDGKPRGICERLGHYDSDCPLKTDNPIPSGKPEAIIRARACPCQSLYTCSESGLEGELGTCS